MPQVSIFGMLKSLAKDFTKKLTRLRWILKMLPFGYLIHGMLLLQLKWEILHWMATHFRIHIPLLNNLSKLWDAQNFLNFPVSFNSFFMLHQICLSYYFSCILGDSFNMKPLSVGCQSSWKIDCVVASCSLDLQRKNPETYERYCKVILAHDSPRSSVYHMQEPAYHMQHIIISNTFS